MLASPRIQVLLQGSALIQPRRLVESHGVDHGQDGAGKVLGEPERQRKKSDGAHHPPAERLPPGLKLAKGSEVRGEQEAPRNGGTQESSNRVQSMRKGRRRTKKRFKSTRKILGRLSKYLGGTVRWIRANRLRRRLAAAGLVVLVILIWTWGDPPPTRTDNLCSIFFEKPSWYRSIRGSAREFGVPEAVQMAILYQESSFRARARPPRRWILWILPGPRPSTAFGYSQALDSTWDQYRERTDRPRAQRHRFKDAAHFMGWYLHEIHRLTKISRDDTYHLYLAYHDGPAGFLRGTHHGKPWLLKVARKVDGRSEAYQSQLDGCRDQLESLPWHLVLPAALLALLAIGWISWKGYWPRWIRRRPRKRRPRS